MMNRILNVVGWVGTALVFAALAVRLANVFGMLAFDPSWDPYVGWSAVAGFAGVVLYILGQWREIARAMGRRQARLGAMVVASVAAVLGILVMINYLAVRQSFRWDLTENQIYSLSDQTIRILEGLEAPIRIMVFAQEPEFPAYRDRLGGYADSSSEVTVEYIDADRQPGIARQYDVQSYGTTVFEYEGRIERVTSSTEQDLTNALIKVLSGTEYAAYFTLGHGEHDPTDTDPRVGYSGIAAALERDNYSVDTLILAQEGDVPANANVVVVAGPTTDFFQPEIDALTRYISGGGKVLFMIDPPQTDGAPLDNLTALVEQWGVQLGNDVVVDVSGMGQLLGTDARVPVVASYPPHPITEDFGTLLTAYPDSRSVTPKPGQTGDGPFVQSILQTSARSWAETNLAELEASGQVQLDEDSGDRQGPISLGVTVTAPVPDGPAAEDESEGEESTDEGEAEELPSEIRLAVFGDSDFVANYTGNITGNADLFLNTVSWLAQQENLIAIRPKLPEDRRLTMTAAQQRSVFWFSLLILPMMIMGSGVYIWMQRR